MSPVVDPAAAAMLRRQTTRETCGMTCRRMHRGRALAGLVAVLAAVLVGCGGGAGAADAMAGSLGEAGDLVSEGDDYESADVAGSTFLLNATRATLSRLGKPGERDDRLTVEVGAGGVLQLLTSVDVDALAVLDRRAGLLEWFNLDTLIRRQVELGRGDWRGVLAEVDVAVLVNRTTGELVKANRQGVAATVPVGGEGDELELSRTDEGILVRNLTERTESLRRLSDLGEIRRGDLPGAPDDRLLNGLGTTSPANWILNATTGELHGLGVDGGWAGKVRVTDPDTVAGQPVAVGDWVYVLLPAAGAVIVVGAEDGAAAGRVDVGRRPGLVLTPDGDGVAVASVPTGYAARLTGTKLLVVRDPADVDVLGERAQAGPPGGPATTGGRGPGGDGAPSPGRGTPGTQGATTEPGGGGGSTAPTTRPPGTPGTTATTGRPGTTGTTATITTPTPPLRYSVSDVSVGTVGETFIDVSWRLSDPGGRVSKVTVNWGTGGTFVNRAELAAASGSYRIGGLLAGTSYAIDLVAAAVDGSFERGPTVTATTTAPPAPPPPAPIGTPAGVSAVAVSPSQVDVTWTIDGATAPIEKITVNWGTGGTFLGRAELGAGARSHRIEGLSPGGTYRVDVVAVGFDGSWKQGNTGQASTPQAEYSAPYNQGISAGPTYLDLSWAIDDPFGRVQSISVNVGSNGTFVGRQVLGGGARSYRFEGLVPGTPYEVNIVAVVSEGDYKIGPLLTATTTA